MWVFIGIVLFICAQVALDWLLYKGRGRVQPDDPNENSPVITGPADALAQRLIDLIKVKKNEKN